MWKINKTKSLIEAMELENGVIKLDIVDREVFIVVIHGNLIV